LIVALEDKLGIHKLQEFHWHNPTKPTGPMPYTSKKRIRVKPSIESLLWLSPNNPWKVKADNRRVLTPYTEGGRRAIANREKEIGKQRPSGYLYGPNSFTDQGGAVPPSLITSVGGGPRAYYEACDGENVKPHPAIMPEKLAEFGILLTTDEDNRVYDPMAGCGTTAAVAQRCKRYWIASDRSFDYASNHIRLRLESQGVAVRRLAA
jgi:DNA modification methylase